MRIFKVALPVLALAAIALFAARAWSDASDAAARNLAEEHARSQFVQRAAVVRAAPDLEHYRNDLRALLRGWFADQADIANRFPALRGQAQPFVPPAPKVRGGDLHDWQALADAQIGALREGKLDLIETAQSQGLRLDLLRVMQVATPQPHLAVDVAVWGAPEESQSEESEPGKESQRMTVPLTFHGLSARFLDAGGKLVARIDGAGEPALRLDLPERLVTDAPPGLVLGRYEMPLFPPEVAQVEWTFSVRVHAPSGEARTAQAVWKMPLQGSWSGSAWGDKDKVIEEGEAEQHAAGEGQQKARPASARAAPMDRNAKYAVWPERD